MSSRIDDYTWMDQAECRDMDLSEHDPFDPPSGGQYQSFVDEALAICARCTVRDDCLADAIEQRDVYGVKGGTTGPEREAILNPVKKVPAQRAPAEAKKEDTPQEAAARAKKIEQRRQYRERNKDRLNAERRATRREEGTYAGMTDEAVEARRERNREYQARARAEKRAAREAARVAAPEEKRARQLEWRRTSYQRHKDRLNAESRAAWASRTPEQIERDREVERSRGRLSNAARRAQNRESAARARVRQEAEREAAELVEDVVLEQETAEAVAS